MNFKLGYIQGRFVSLINEKIQAYPEKEWKKDLSIASKNGFSNVELTLDLDKIYETPLLNSGNDILKNELYKRNINAVAVTADFFMQSLPWQKNNNGLEELSKIVKDVILNMHNLGIRILVLPFVDESSLDQKDIPKAISFLSKLTTSLKNSNVKIAIEIDFEPNLLKNMMDMLPDEIFGINYDLGNSASLDFDIEEEFSVYGNKIIHIHIKDRLINGTTVSLGKGNVDFIKFFSCVEKIGYDDYMIFQTARSKDGLHQKEMKNNLKFFLDSSKKNTEK